MNAISLSLETGRRRHVSYRLRLCIFFVQLLITLLLYNALLFVYTILAPRPLLFFVSVYLAVALALLSSIVIHKVVRGVFDMFTLTVMSFCCAMIIILFAVFGPVFIDRSISYHIAFYAVEQGSIDVKEMEKKFAFAVFQKRIDDAVAAGFLLRNTDGRFSPTTKAKIFTYVMKPLGVLSHSLTNYTIMSQELKNEELVD